MHHRLFLEQGLASFITTLDLILYSISSIFSIIKFYGLIFFIENYNIGDNQVYDFVLGCSENSEIIHYFNQNLHQKVIQELDTYVKIYSNESD